MKAWIKPLGLTLLLGTLGCGEGPKPPPQAGNAPNEITEPVSSASPTAQTEKTETTLAPPATESASVEPLKLEPLEFQVGDQQYKIAAPSGAKVKDVLGDVQIHFSTRYNIDIKKGHSDLSAQSQDFLRPDSVKIISESPDTIVFTDQEATDQLGLKTSYKFATNITVGEQALCIYSMNRGAERESAIHSEADCRAMLEAARQIAPASPTP